MIPLRFALLAPDVGAASGSRTPVALPDSPPHHFGEIVGLCGDINGEQS